MSKYENPDEQFTETADNMETNPNPKNSFPAAKKEQVPLILMIGGALGGVILIIVSVVIGTVIANRMFPPHPPIVIEKQADQEEEQTQARKKNKFSQMPDDEDFDDSNSLLEDTDWLVFNSGRVQTNVKYPTNKVGLMELSITYKPHYIERLTELKFLIGGTKDKPYTAADTTSAMYQKFKQSVVARLNTFIASKDANDLQSLFSLQELPKELKEYLKSTFRETGLVINRVEVTYFMITTM